jgi:hypothetical protein
VRQGSRRRTVGRIEKREREGGRRRGADRWGNGVSGRGKKKRRRGRGPLRELDRWAGWAER